MYKLLTTLLLVQSAIVWARAQSLPFTLQGTINTDTGVVALHPFYDQAYYPEKSETLEAKVENGQFSLNGSIPYPMGFTLRYGQQYESRLFVIVPGSQSMTVNIEANGEVPAVDNPPMREYAEAYTEAYQAVSHKRAIYEVKADSLRQLYQNKVPDSLQLELEREIKGLYAAGDSVLLHYVTAHPDSYLAFWNFIRLFSFDGYNVLFDSIQTKFSDALKNTYSGKVLAAKLAASGKLALGKTFPSIAAQDAVNQPLDSTLFLKNKYTFVDFWYSNCNPCIAQFPHLRETYAKYKNQGFEIVGISTDRERYKAQWEKAIEKYQLSWPQYWDKNGKAALELSINKFPTNYLLDSQGKIIGKDLRPVELSQFLQDNI